MSKTKNKTRTKLREGEHPNAAGGRATTKFRPWMVVEIYRIMRAGMTEADAAKAIGLTHPRFSNWKAKRKSVRYAVERGREDANATVSTTETVNNFVDYVYGHLKPETRKLWEEMRFWENEADATERTEALLQDKGDRVRQELFVHALVSSGFNLSAAMRMAAVSRNTYNRWILRADFNELMDELTFHKKNMFEGALLDLVKARNPQAVIFANKTQNADRGYGDKTTVEHTGTVHHQHEVVPFDKLDLSPACLREVLDATRRYKEAQAQLEGGKPKLLETKATVVDV